MRKFAEIVGWLYIINWLTERFGIDEFLEKKIDQLKEETNPKPKKETIVMGFH